MEIQKFIDKLFKIAEARGIKEYQVSYQEGESSTIQVYEQQVLEQSNNASNILNFAVRANGKIGRYTTARFEEEDVERVVDEALENALVLECDENFFFYDGKGKYKEVKKHTPLMEELGKLDKTEFLKKLEKLAYEADARINKVIMTKYNYRKGRQIMRNSLGLDIEDNGVWASALLYVSAKENGVVKTYGDGVAFDKEEDFNPKVLVDKVVNKAVSRLNTDDIVSQKTAVIFENSTFASILGSISNIFSAYTVDTGKSKLKGKTGQAIASPKVTLIDNPWLDNGFATSAFDSEGVPTKYKELIKDGVLQGFLYGLSMAHKHKAEPTGNGTGGLGSQVFNFYLQNGTMPKVELLKKLGTGIYIDKLNGLNGAVNTVSGDFSMGAEGYQVKEGKLGTYLNQFTISGNIYDLLLDIDEIGNDLDFDMSPLGSPSVLVKNITVANN